MSYRSNIQQRDRVCDTEGEMWSRTGYQTSILFLDFFGTDQNVSVSVYISWANVSFWNQRWKKSTQTCPVQIWVKVVLFVSVCVSDYKDVCVLGCVVWCFDKWCQFAPSPFSTLYPRLPPHPPYTWWPEAYTKTYVKIKLIKCSHFLNKITLTGNFSHCCMHYLIVQDRK